MPYLLEYLGIFLLHNIDLVYFAEISVPSQMENIKWEIFFSFFVYSNKKTFQRNRTDRTDCFQPLCESCREIVSAEKLK
ncbi:hypothetical protein [Gluconacetobacter liquefaciens]|uniref:Uncharacterized protein n=1 Tax=Gluconacetobacter liquefaciens TaxID=89584 RepID=A0A7W4JIJ3_GLULI|nr:hypothetical protein [Gluconacetobacter liquefaciens]MBB2185255.1 hypothetical protein [Gluconacetobacter liquefaciens]